jgi:hypothetical protein
MPRWFASFAPFWRSRFWDLSCSGAARASTSSDRCEIGCGGRPRAVAGVLRVTGHQAAEESVRTPPSAAGRSAFLSSLPGNLE